MPTFYTNSGSLRSLEVSGSAIISGSSERLVRIIGTGSAILSISASTGPILEVSEFAPAGSNKMLVFTSGSVDVFSIEKNSKVVITGSLEISNSLTASLQQGYVWVGDANGKTSMVPTSSFGGGGSITVADEGTAQGTATFLNFIGAGVSATVSSNTGSITISSAGTFPYTGSAQITGSLGVTGSISFPDLFAGGGSNCGITFPANSLQSTNVNTLDDYEEGSWTPQFSGAGATFSYANQLGRYTKIGRLVTIMFYIKLNTSGNSNFTANPLTIVTLPFASDGTTGVIHFNPIHWSGFTQTLVYAAGYITPLSTTLTLERLTAAGTSPAAMEIDDMNTTGGSEIGGIMSYITSGI